MRIDTLDIRILKAIFSNTADVYYINDITTITNESKSIVRLRLRKLVKFGFIKRVKTYPEYYLPNPMIAEKVADIKIPVAAITHGF